MCPANGELENGDAESPVDFLCRVADLRACALDILVTAHGPCEEHCEGGDGYAEMMETLARLRARPKDWPRPRSKLLPVLGATAGGGRGSGGCSSCSAR